MVWPADAVLIHPTGQRSTVGWRLPAAATAARAFDVTAVDAMCRRWISARLSGHHWGDERRAVMLPRSGRVGTIHTSAAEVRDRSRAGAFYVQRYRAPRSCILKPGGKGLGTITTATPRVAESSGRVRCATCLSSRACGCDDRLDDEQVRPVMSTKWARKWESIPTIVRAHSRFNSISPANT